MSFYHYLVTNESINVRGDTAAASKFLHCGEFELQVVLKNKQKNPTNHITTNHAQTFVFQAGGSETKEMRVAVRQSV